MADFTSFLYVFVASIILNIAYVIVYIKFVDYKKVQFYQSRVRQWMAKRKKALATGDPKLLRDVAKEAEIIKKMQAEVMTEMMKPMFLTFFIFIILSLIARNIFAASVISFPFPIWFGGETELNGFWTFVLMGFFLNAIIRPIMKYFNIMQ